MSDAAMNDVLGQYFKGPVESVFRPSSFLAGERPPVVSRGDVERFVLELRKNGRLEGFDHRSTVFNLMLPAGTVLNTEDAPSDAAKPKRSKRTPKTPKAEAGRGALVDAHVHRTADSLDGLAGYHGTIFVGKERIYYAVGVLSAMLRDENGDEFENGIVAFDRPWKNLVATFYHELCEARTDPDVEEANDTGRTSLLGWTSRQGEEIGDFPISQDPELNKVFLEFPLSNGRGSVPIQLPYSNRVQGPEDPSKP